MKENVRVVDRVFDFLEQLSAKMNGYNENSSYNPQRRNT